MQNAIQTLSLCHISWHRAGPRLLESLSMGGTAQPWDSAVAAPSALSCLREYRLSTACKGFPAPRAFRVFGLRGVWCGVGPGLVWFGFWSGLVSWSGPLVSWLRLAFSAWAPCLLMSPFRAAIPGSLLRALEQKVVRR